MVYRRNNIPLLSDTDEDGIELPNFCHGSTDADETDETQTSCRQGVNTSDDHD